MAWLNEAQISTLVTVCHDSYEMQCDWNNAMQSAAEYAVDEFGIKPNRTAIYLVCKRAKAAWHGTSMHVKRIVESD